MSILQRRKLRFRKDEWCGQSNTVRIWWSPAWNLNLSPLRPKWLSSVVDKYTSCVLMRWMNKESDEWKNMHFTPRLLNTAPIILAKQSRRKISPSLGPHWRRQSCQRRPPRETDIDWQEEYCFPILAASKCLRTTQDLHRSLPGHQGEWPAAKLL